MTAPHLYLHPKKAKHLFDGWEPPATFAGDGCTCAPDFAINGADLRQACRWHDWAYQQGGDEATRTTADRHFLTNLKATGCPLLTRRLYFYRVRFWGVLAFNYWTTPPTVRQWLALLATRYTETDE